MYEVLTHPEVENLHLTAWLISPENNPPLSQWRQFISMLADLQLGILILTDGSISLWLEDKKFSLTNCPQSLIFEYLLSLESSAPSVKSPLSSHLSPHHLVNQPLNLPCGTAQSNDDENCVVFTRNCCSTSCLRAGTRPSLLPHCELLICILLAHSDGHGELREGGRGSPPWSTWPSGRKTPSAAPTGRGPSCSFTKLIKKYFGGWPVHMHSPT